ncbi:MarR family winged helix-turn-helix transcriptional regulator [Streptomyces sp. TS71-3]|uniref:MarR family winged helix-turn-helix transcriptional regulator n=1 Tax=Streptomyces sp. TS71-3 TaxID=2733862 RepID=UPI001BB31EBA|nr:MarR family transcriptional regulator [Streptomyces sp. TS71-3]
MSENPAPSAPPPSSAALSPSAVQASREVRAVISRLRRRILKASEVEDITLGQASALARLSDKGGVTASELASAEGVRHQSMTATVASLAAMGLVERSPDPGDGRRLLITLTAEGQRRVEEGRQARTEWLAGQLQDRCTEEERRAVIAAMAVLGRLTRD